MVIVVDCGDDVQRYAQDFPTLVFPRPLACPRCATAGHLVGHGSYPRTVIDPTRAIAIRVKRLLCTVCRRTVSLLPTFCLPWRHYQTTTIQAVLGRRVVAKGSWAAVQRCFCPADLPTRTTCREWVGAFARASERYGAHLFRALATWPARSSSVDVAVSDLAGVAGPSAQLIAAVPHLLSWLGDVGVQVVGGGQRWLATLWQWGSITQLGRLV
jgi:hypothetical protein